MDQMPQLPQFQYQAPQAARTGAAVGVGLPVLGELASVATTILNNRAQRKLSMDMYNLQRKDALADWQRQVDYQSPAAQMQRYKEAGINPNMVYGNMQNSPVVRSTPMDVPNLRPIPVPNVGGALMQYQQLKKQQAQTDLTEEAIKASINNQKLQNISIAAGILKNAGMEFDLGMKRDLKETVFNSALANLENVQFRNDTLRQGLEFNARTMEDRIKLVSARLASENAGIDKAIQETINMKAMLPYQKREAEARIGNILASTQGKQLQNQYDKLTMGDRVTAQEYTMQILGGNLSIQDQQKAMNSLKQILLKNDIDMMGVNNVLETIGGIKDIISPFSKSDGIKETIEHTVDEDGAIRQTKHKTFRK